MKRHKPLWRISVTTTPEAEDAVAEMLGTVLGAPAASYFDLESGVSTVTSYLDGKPPLPKARAALAGNLKLIADCDLNVGAARVEIARMKREDWAESWKRHFHPLEIGQALLIKPSWSKQRPRKGQALVVLDPGLSFGTGQHPTTFFCLQEIGRMAKSGVRPGVANSFLDVGTGSGILAIAAAKLGFSPVHAFDFDPEAVRVAKENARKNRVNFQLTRSDVTKLSLKPARRYNLVCANLISNLLIAECRRIVNRVQPEGTLVVAGILAEEFDKVQQVFEKLDMKLKVKRIEKEWCSGSFCFV